MRRTHSWARCPVGPQELDKQTCFLSSIQIRAVRVKVTLTWQILTSFAHMPDRKSIAMHSARYATVAK